MCLLSKRVTTNYSVAKCMSNDQLRTNVCVHVNGCENEILSFVFIFEIILLLLLFLLLLTFPAWQSCTRHTILGKHKQRALSNVTFVKVIENQIHFSPFLFICCLSLKQTIFHCQFSYVCLCTILALSFTCTECIILIIIGAYKWPSKQTDCDLSMELLQKFTKKNYHSILDAVSESRTWFSLTSRHM